MEEDTLIKKKDTEGYSKYARIHREKWSTDIKDILSHVDKLRNNPVFKSSLAFLELREGTRVLEIGGGGCEASYIFSEQSSFIVAIDKNLDEICGLNAAKKLLKHEGNTNVMLVLADYDYLPFKESAFDIAYGKATLHHSVNLGRTIKEIVRVMKPTGKLAVEEAARGVLVSEPFAYRKYYKMEGMTREQNEQSPTVPEWKSSFEIAGLRNIRVQFSLSQWLLFLLQKVSSSEMKKYSDKMPSFEKKVIKILGFSLLNRLVQFIILMVSPILKIYMYYFGFPPIIPHEFTRKRGGGGILWD